MEDLRKLLKSNQVVTLEYGDSTIRYGLVSDFNYLSVLLFNRTIKQQDFTESLENKEDDTFLDSKIIEIYERTADGLEKIWDREDYVDWTQVKVDTPILVSLDGITWYKRHFTKYENGVVYAFDDGTTSFSNSGSTCGWDYAKIYKPEDDNK